MSFFWKSRTGKLVMGGCGAQVGMLFAFGGLAGLLLLSVACVFFNMLSVGLTQSLAQPPPPLPASPTSVPTAASSLYEEVEARLAGARLLLGELELLQANATAMPLPTGAIIALPSSKPIVMANQDGASLYSGPGVGHEKIGVLPPGESLEIVGRNPDSTWWLVLMPDDLFAWASDRLVIVYNVDQTIPVVTIPSLMPQPDSGGSTIVISDVITPTATARPTPPPGTPTPAIDQARTYVEDMTSYQKVSHALMVPPSSASLSPDGNLIAMTERIKVYLIDTDGAHTDIIFEDDDKRGPLGWAVWSPDGEYLAFTVGFKNPKCRPCVSVALYRMFDKSITYLEATGDLDTDVPRWTQDGHLLINVHKNEPANGIAYIYNVHGFSQVASGVYTLSSSHEGQKWHPWLPGRIWRADVSERADSYHKD